jgi:hypothetical protein
MTSTSATVLLTLPLLAAVVATQTPPAQDRAAALKQSLAQNQAALRQYMWIETTEISMKGEVKKQEQKQCSYGADGKVQKTPLPGQAAAPKKESGGGGRRGGRVKEAVVANKVEDLKDYMEQVAALVHQYVPPDPQRIQAAQAAGKLTAPTGTQPLMVKDYLKPGDQLSIGLDAASLKLTSYAVSSYVEKPKEDDVTLNVTFAALPDGTSYPQHVLLDVKAKAIQVKVTNSGHKKSGS